MKFDKTKEAKEIHRWMNDMVNREILFEHPSQCIISILKRGIAPEDLWEISYRLQTMSVWFGTLAIYAETTKSSIKNEHWANYLNVFYYSNRFAIRSIEETGEGSLIWTHLHGNFILSLGLGRLDQAIWLGGKIHENINEYLLNCPIYKLTEIAESDMEILIEDPGDPRNLNSPGIHSYSESPLCGFCMRIWLILTERRKPKDALPVEWPQCGVYEGLFTNWDKPHKLIFSLVDACDFHMKRMKPDRRIHHDIPEFETTPFRQIPFEILAYRNVRAKMGLETPWPSHPLLDSPFVKNLPEELPPSDDPLLNDVLSSVRNVISDI